MKSEITTSLVVKDGELSINVGRKLFTFAIDEHANKQVMLKTEDLSKVAALFAHAAKEWERCQEMEKLANSTVSA